MKKIELLCPAGKYESAIAAINSGADALYLAGNRFGARANAANFNFDELKSIIDLAHAYNIKIHVTLNTLIYDEELEDVKRYIKELYDLNVDALIIQDLGVISYIRENYPDFELHSSTQLHTYNIDSIRFLKSIGFKRVVLARECSLEQINSFSSVDIEKEIFIHGALCISFSGQCLFSAFNSNRSGNRGECAQSCRMPYKLMCEGKILNKDKYLLSPKDLMSLNNVQDLLNAGVDSFKIEGRMKSSQYVGLTTLLYRKVIDEHYKVTNNDIHNLKAVFNREYTNGHLYNELGSKLMNQFRPNHIGNEIGKVIKASKSKITIKLSDTLHQHDGIRLIQNEDVGFKVNKIYKDGLLVNEAYKGDIIELDNYDYIEKDAKVVKTSDILLNKEIDINNNIKRKVLLDLKVIAKANNPLKLIINNEYFYESNSLIQEAKKIAIDDKSIKKQMNKTNDTIYEFNTIEIDNDMHSFISIKELNEARRELLNQYFVYSVNKFERNSIPYSKPNIQDINQVHGLNVCVLNEEQLLACLEFNNIDIFVEDIDLYTKYENYSNIYKQRSNIYPEEDDDSFEMYGDSGGIKHNKRLDYTLNVVNSSTLKFLDSFNVSSICLSPELKEDEIDHLDLNIKAAVEIIVYAKIKVMSSKYCLVNHLKLDNDKKNCHLCKLKNYYLEDVFDNKFYLRGDSNCNMHIYNHEAIDRFDNIHHYLDLGISSFRINLSDETSDEVISLIKKFQTNYQ